MKKINKDFDILVGNLLFAYRQFCLNEIGHRIIKDEVYRNFLKLWETILVSSEIGYWLGLAKIFEQPTKQFEETISIYYFLDFEFKDYIETIKKINTFRNKVITHIDLRSARDLENFMKDLDLKRSDAGPLFEKTIDVVNKLRGEFGLTEDLKSRFGEEKTKIENEFTKFIEQLKKDQ